MVEEEQGKVRIRFGELAWEYQKFGWLAVAICDIGPVPGE